MNWTHMDVRPAKPGSMSLERRLENLDTREQLKKMRAETGMSQVKFAEYMGIPRRTIEEWERGSRKPPEYVVRLIAYKLHVEGLISSDL